MRFNIKLAGEVYAQTNNESMAHTIIDILCGEAEVGKKLELFVDEKLILAWDERGNQVHPSVPDRHDLATSA